MRKSFVDLQERMRIPVQIREEMLARKECVAWETSIPSVYL